MTAEIITIGDEILIGQIVDTNSAIIAQYLNKIGISVHQITSVEDDKSHILQTFKEASERVDIVIITGGLGPTRDDLTKDVLCEYFDDFLVNNKVVLTHIEALFEKHSSAPISNLNKEQALVPSKAKVLFNKYGSAPGLWMEKGRTLFIAMPGVPYEMKMMMELEVIPRLTKEYKRPFIFHKTIKTYGLGETAIALRIEQWERELPDWIKLAYLPDLGKVRLRLSGKGENEAELKLAIELEFEKIYPILEDIISDKSGDDEDITRTISKLLIAKKQFLAVAESFTGGEISAEFTRNPGVSKCYKGGIVPYATQSKSEVLGVSSHLIDQYSVVSEEVCQAMAMHVKKLFKSDYALATTGNAGPTKGDSKAEVGTVYISLATPVEVITKKLILGDSREQVVKKAVAKAFEMLLKELNEK